MLSKEVGLRVFGVLLAVALGCAGCASLFPPETPKIQKLDEAAVRGFVAAQTAAWNARDLDRFYANCAPDAAFIAIHWNADGTITREQRSLADERAAAERFFKSRPGKFSEVDVVDKVDIAPDAMSARVLGHETARFANGTRAEVINATTDETLVLRKGRIVSLGQTTTSAR